MEFRFKEWLSSETKIKILETWNTEIAGGHVGNTILNLVRSVIQSKLKDVFT